MNALFLKDLADKVRRGLRGRIEDGKSGGGNAYGYDVVRTFDAEGEPVRGERRIDPAEAEIIREIFARYAGGASPRKIAMDLNARGVSAPRGGAWSGSTLNGNRARGTGVLNNEMYIGRLVWNRLRYAKDPETGKRRSRANEDEAVVATETPELAIVSKRSGMRSRRDRPGLEGRSRNREIKGGEPDDALAPFWSKQRPRYLFSGLMRCGVCGGGFSKISAAHFGCSTARNKGESVCANRLTIRRDTLEATVMDGLRNRLMDPVLFEAFAQEFTAEWNWLQAGAGAHLSQLRAEHERVDRQIERLVDALAEGAPAARVTQKLRELERRRLDLEAELSTAAAPAPRLHPNLAEVYRRKVADLQQALAEDDVGPARELVRGLVEAIIRKRQGGPMMAATRGGSYQ